MSIRSFLTAGALLVALSGCSSAPAHTDPAPAAAGAPVVVSAGLTDEQFLSFVHDDMDYYDKVPDTNVVAVAQAVCAMMKSGVAAVGKDAAHMRLVKTLVDGGMPAFEAGQFIVFSVGRYCPEQMANLPAA